MERLYEVEAGIKRLLKGVGVVGGSFLRLEAGIKRLLEGVGVVGGSMRPRPGLNGCLRGWGYMYVRVVERVSLYVWIVEEVSLYV